MDEKLLKLRKIRKAKKPTFSRQDSHKKARVNSKWRRPKGLQSKMRYGKKGYSRAVSAGFGAPNAVKGLTPEGLIQVIISNISDLKKIEEGMGGIISKTTGQRKKMEIVKKADELGIKILNVKNPQEYLKSTNQIMQKKKEKKHETIKEKEKKKAEKEKISEEKKKEDLAEKLTDEERKDKENQERDKILTKKES